jgi:hypothetical protein
LVGVEAGQQGGAGGTAACSVVELGEPDTVFCKSIEMWGFDLTAVASEIGEAHVVRHDDHDVWARSSRERGRRKDEEEKRQERYVHPVHGSPSRIIRTNPATD